MTTHTQLLHAAVHCDTLEHAHTFFLDILGLREIKTFSLDETLSHSIFSIKQHVDIRIFGNDSMQIEVFIHPYASTPSYNHLCLRISNKSDFIKRCKEFGLMPYSVQKGERQLLFVRDFTGNLYEIKE